VVHKHNFRDADLNEAACGGGRYAWAPSKIFLSQRNGSSIGHVVIDEPAFARLSFIQVGSLLLTQRVRLLSPLRPASVTKRRRLPSSLVIESAVKISSQLGLSSTDFR